MKIGFRYAPPLALVVAAGIACYGPTQVTVGLSTDFACGEVAMASALFVGAAASGDSAVGDQACRQEGAVGELGSIVLVPRSDRSARFTLTGVLATWPNGGSPKDPRDCLDDPTACVVARRTLSFFEHDARSFDLRFYRACVGVRCQDTETCVPDVLAGGTKCVSNDVDAPAPDPCLDPTACGGPVPVSVPDAGPADASGDAVVSPTKCGGPANDGVLLADVAHPTGLLGTVPPMVVAGGFVYWLQGDQLASVKTDGSAYLAFDTVAGQQYFGDSLALGKNDVVWGIGHSHLVSVSGRDIGPHDFPGEHGLVAIRGDHAYASAAGDVYAFDQSTGTPTSFPGTGDPIVAMAVSDAYLFLATKSSLARRDQVSGIQSQTLTTSATELTARGDGAAFAERDPPRSLYWWSGGIVTRIGELTVGYSNVHFDPDGTYLYVAADDGTGRTLGRMQISDRSPSTVDPTPYRDMVGPAFDAACVYYWASLPGDPPGIGRIYVRPR